MMHFAIDTDGNVFSYKGKGAATGKAAEIGGHYASDDAETGLKDVPTPMLVKLHNLIRPEKPVTRFADRKTAETRMKGVLEVLSKPGEAPAVIGAISAPAIVAEGENNDTAPGAEGDAEMASKTAGKRAAKKGAAKKTTAKKGATRADRPTISDATVRKVIKMRGDGKGWPEILKDLGEKQSFIQVVRPLMKAIDKTSVKKMGPGSPNYGKGK